MLTITMSFITMTELSCNLISNSELHVLLSHHGHCQQPHNC